MNPTAAAVHERRLRRERVYARINAERASQDRKWGWPNDGMAGCDDYKKLAILHEETGEVANALLDKDPREHVVEELVQCAAVCVAWLESIEEFNR